MPYEIVYPLNLKYKNITNTAGEEEPPIQLQRVKGWGCGGFGRRRNYPHITRAWAGGDAGQTYKNKKLHN